MNLIFQKTDPISVLTQKSPIYFHIFTFFTFTKYYEALHWESIVQQEKDF